MSFVSQLLENHNVSVRRGVAENHHGQDFVERFNRTLAERLFGHQYAQEMNFVGTTKVDQRSSKWAAAVVAGLNN